MPTRSRWLAPLLVAGFLAATAGVVWLLGPEPAPQPPRASAPASSQPAAPEPPPAPAPAAVPPAVASPPPPEAPADPLASLATDDPRGPWAQVDLDQARADLPDNLYWELSMPTRDPDLIEARREERTRWNEEYGKVLSGTATEEEVLAYYEHRQRLHRDSVEFAHYVLERYRDTLSAQDASLLELASTLHTARLQELPRELADALARREAHEAVRRAWLEDQAAFEAELPDGP